MPTIHECVAVRQMGAKGITTDKGDFDRWIRKDNDLLRNIWRKIADLTGWIKAAKEELSQPQVPNLAALYRDTKPIYDELQGIKWKGKREKFERKHEGELRTFHMARRKLDKYRSPDGKIPAHAWEQEQTRLQQYNR